MAKSDRPIIIVRRKKKGGGGHHGGAWKVAYADFVTAMMAFFMVMWLITSVSKEQRAAIFDYFKNPSMEEGKSVKPAPGQAGPGGASTAVINLGGGLDSPRSATPLSTGLGISHDDPNRRQQPVTREPPVNAEAEAEKVMAEAEHKRLESLMEELQKAIDMSQALRPFKDQLLLDITPEGLRIQIVDAQNRPMFDLGSAKLKTYTAQILSQLAPYLEKVPNRLSLTGHTDTTPYLAQAGYNNWDLSADRANAARRALEAGGLAADKVARVVGLSSAVLFDTANSRNPVNRRISIIVMTKRAEAAALKTDGAPGVDAAGLANSTAGAGSAAGAGAGAGNAAAASPLPGAAPASMPDGATPMESGAPPMVQSPAGAQPPR
jgi:chemotaxis protein MotB